ncbi:hypothetical protein [Photobacterium nomapromontoriensis]|uniref:hypothetical protein n=1 Tax=Photobacterium nomapromontoriensis TaxID=2910237 RepID=UPI003D0B2A29
MGHHQLSRLRYQKKIGRSKSLVRGEAADLNGISRRINDLDGHEIDCDFECMSSFRQEAKKLSQSQSLTYNQRKYYIAKQTLYSEQLGELAAEGYMKKQYPGATRLKSDYPDSGMKKNQFDQIWQTADGKLIIVEAKGGTATLGTRTVTSINKRAEQGTPEYKDSIIDAMEDWYLRNRKKKDSEGMRKFMQTLDLLQKIVIIWIT